MNIFRFLTDPSPGGYQDKNRLVRWLVARCSIFPANVWTAARIVAPIFIIPAYYWSSILSLILFALFAATDFIDGKVARHRGQASNVGAWLDPLADKVFVVVCFYWFGLIARPILSVELFWLFTGVELGGRVIVGIVWKIRRSKIDVKAKWYGKIKFGLQIALGAWLLLTYIVSWTPKTLLDVCLALITLLTAVSVASHIWNIPEPFCKKN